MTIRHKAVFKGLIDQLFKKTQEDFGHEKKIGISLKCRWVNVQVERRQIHYIEIQTTFTNI